MTKFATTQLFKYLNKRVFSIPKSLKTEQPDCFQFSLSFLSNFEEAVWFFFLNILYKTSEIVYSYSTSEKPIFGLNFTVEGKLRQRAAEKISFRIDSAHCPHHLVAEGSNSDLHVKSTIKSHLHITKNMCNNTVLSQQH